MQRALTAIGIGAISGAFVLTAIEFADGHDAGSLGAPAVTSQSTDSPMPSATPTAPPSVPPPSLPYPTVPSPTAPEMASPAASQAATTAPLSNRLDETDRGAALPAEREARPRPVALQTSEIDVTPYPIRPIGLKPDGELEIPDETQIGWYRYGATAGRDGATVLAAHVSWNGTNGPFAQLDRLQPGSQIEVALDDGSRRNYVVTEQALYEKEGLPRERLWRNTGPETLVLITCGGDFNPEIRRFKHNIVVYASPLG